MAFAHLHVHSEYSLLDGAIKVDSLIDRAVQNGQSAVAITDHGWIANAVRFQKSAQKKGIKSIIGMETYMASQDDMRKPAKSGGDNYHLTLIAQNAEGYRNLVRLTSLAHVHGLSYKPRIDYSTLVQHSRGIIVLSGCIGAEIPQRIVRGDGAGAEKRLVQFQHDFGDRFYVEVMYHGATNGLDHTRVEDEYGNVMMQEHELNAELVRLANKHGVGLIATNDAHYLEREDGCAHDTLLCIGMGAWKDKPNRMRFPGASHRSWEFYIKSEAEMLAVSLESWWHTACSNTAVLADSIQAGVIPTGQTLMPRYEAPDDDIQFNHWLRKHGYQA